MSLRFLIAGLGSIGQRHARNLRALFGDTVELLAFRQRRLRGVITTALDRDDSRDVESELGCTVYERLEDALQAKPDAVFVCTPTSCHLEVAQLAADAGCHLFIEKPVSHTLHGVERLRQTVSDQDLVALVGCQWRYHPAVVWLRNRLQAGMLGRLLGADITYAEYLPAWHPYEDYRLSYAARREMGGGVVLTQIHDYDLAWWLFGRPRRVTATGGHLSDLEIDVEDTVDARLECEILVSVHQCFAAMTAPRRTLVIETDRGLITLDLLTSAITLPSDIQLSAPFAPYERNEMFLAEARHFCACIEGRENPAVPLQDGIAVLKIALAVKEALRTGLAVALDHRL
jgi:predicted dehydrogenase